MIDGMDEVMASYLLLKATCERYDIDLDVFLDIQREISMDESVLLTNNPENMV
jgi:hypothetical protein